MQFHSLLAFTVAAFSISVGATPTSVNMLTGVVSLAEMKAWVDTQDPSEMTLIGDPFAALRNPLTLHTDSAEAVTVTFCSTQAGTVCTAPCTTVTGQGVCINAPGTQRLFATSQVAFCSKSNCAGNCNDSTVVELDWQTISVLPPALMGLLFRPKLLTAPK